MAVYTDVALDELEEFLTAYDLGAVVSFKGIAEGVENSNFLLTTERGRFILTLYEKRVREDDLPYFVDLMEHLAERGVPCPTPIHDKTGNALNRLCGRPAAIITFLDGVWVRRPGPEHCAALGAAMAGFHLASEDFPGYRENDLSVPGWNHLLKQCGTAIDDLEPGLYEALSRELSYLEAHWPSGLPEGVIHADLFPDNVFFLGGELTGLIDFYFACNDFYAYDLAVCLNAWCFEADGSFNITKAARLTNRYADGRPLTDAERAALPILARGAAIRFLLTRAFDWLNHDRDAYVKPKDPLEYARILRFHQNVKDSGAYGLKQG